MNVFFYTQCKHTIYICNSGREWFLSILYLVLMFFTSQQSRCSFLCQHGLRSPAIQCRLAATCLTRSN